MLTADLLKYIDENEMVYHTSYRDRAKKVEAINVNKFWAGVWMVMGIG